MDSSVNGLAEVAGCLLGRLTIRMDKNLARQRRWTRSSSPSSSGKIVQKLPDE
jgi:hypothetical protein